MSHEVPSDEMQALLVPFETKVLGKTHKRASRMPLGQARCLLFWGFWDQETAPSSTCRVSGQVPFSWREGSG